MSFVVLKFTRELGNLFTSDDDFLDIFETVNIPFANMMFWMNLQVANNTILGAMGRTKDIFKLELIGSWIF